MARAGERCEGATEVRESLAVMLWRRRPRDSLAILDRGSVLSMVRTELNMAHPTDRLRAPQNIEICRSPARERDVRAALT